MAPGSRSRLPDVRDESAEAKDLIHSKRDETQTEVMVCSRCAADWYSLRLREFALLQETRTKRAVCVCDFCIFFSSSPICSAPLSVWRHDGEAECHLAG